MKRLFSTRFFRREDAQDKREPTILEHGDPVIVERTRELMARRRLRSLPEEHPSGL